MKDELYKKVFKRAEEIRRMMNIPKKTPVHYEASTGWENAMGGEGAPVPDAFVWRQRYNDSQVTIKGLKEIIQNQEQIIQNLKQGEKE